MLEPTIAARLVVPLLDAATKLGGAGLGLELARLAGGDPAALREPERRIPLPDFYALLERAAERTAESGGAGSLGLHYSLGLDPTAFDVLGFLAMTSPNLGVAFDRMFRYQALLVEGETGSLQRASGRVTVRVRNWGPTRPAHALWNEAAMVDIVVNGRQLVGHDFEVEEVRFRHSAPADPSRLQAALAAPLRFDAEDDAVVIPEAVLALPMPGADPAMFEFFEREAARRAAARPHPQAHASPLDAAREQIEAALPEGPPELTELARALAVSPRTLQRRLADHGTSLRKLVDEVRHQLALRHLAADLSIAEVSFLLGFSQPSAFHRAFRRWTERTPAQWRADRHADPEPRA